MSPRALVQAAALMVSSPTAWSAEPATYRLEIDIAWSAATHPFEFPAGAHITRIIGATHHSRYILFGDGRTASSGLESVAENGRNVILQAEFEDAKRRGRVGTIFEGDGLRPVPGKTSATFAVTEMHGLASFSAMVAPSPDWFTGVSAVPLLVDGEWVERIEAPLWAWDAGTNTGSTYSGDYADTQPRESIRLLATPHMLGPRGLARIGTATFVKTE